MHRIHRGGTTGNLFTGPRRTTARLAGLDEHARRTESRGRARFCVRGACHRGGTLVPAAERYQTLFVTATAQALLLVLVYTALAIGALRLMWRNKTSQPWWRWIVFPMATVVPGLALYGTFVPFPDYPERFGLFAGIAALALVAIWVWRVRNTPRNREVK